MVEEVGQLKEVEEFGGAWGFKELTEFEGLRGWVPEELGCRESSEFRELGIWEAGDCGG